LVVCVAFVDVVTLSVHLSSLKQLPTNRKKCGAN
jgi:hypothetical protein